MSEKFPEDEMQDEMADMEAGGEGDPSEEGDFVEEDWEAYDDEAQYIDDGDGDGGKAARASSFNKILISGGILVALAVGGFTVFGGKREELGLPVMEKTGAPVQVAEGQKVEFHSDTKVAAKDAFGIKYGESTNREPVIVEEEAPPAGLLNNPSMINDIRGEKVGEFEDAIAAEDGAAATGAQLPQPAPISTADASATPGLIPMPDESAEFSSAEENVPRDPFADDASEETVMGPTPPAPASDPVMERLDAIEDRLAQLDALQTSVEALQEKIDNLEKAPARSAPKAVSSSSSSRPAAARPQWVLKSAQPGRAMVSKRGESDMVEVAIGENLRGLGRITGIYMEDGQWIVQGTNGKIVQ